MVGGGVVPVTVTITGCDCTPGTALSRNPAIAPALELPSVRPSLINTKTVEPDVVVLVPVAQPDVTGPVVGAAVGTLPATPPLAR